jgi:hypothetical protein
MKRKKLLFTVFVAFLTVLCVLSLRILTKPLNKLSVNTPAKTILSTPANRSISSQRNEVSAFVKNVPSVTNSNLKSLPSTTNNTYLTNGDGQIGASALKQIASIEAEKASRNPAQQKISSYLLYAEKMSQGVSIAQGVPSPRVSLDKDENGRVSVDIKANVTDTLLQYIETLGGKVINDFPQYQAIRANVPLTNIELLAARTDVVFITPATHAMNNTVDSQGDYTHQANTARTTFGVNGSGLKIGVLSDSVTNYPGCQISGLVTVLPNQNGTNYPYVHGEGTAMLEIVNDLAPGAQLYFATAEGGEANFANNIQQLYAAGCNIIVDDILYYDESPFQDGIVAQAVNSVTSQGVLYFSSASNSGNQDSGTSGTWEGDFVNGGSVGSPVNGEGGFIHSFGAANYDRITQTSSSGSPTVLFWSDPSGDSTNDYDLYVLDSTGTSVVDYSTDSQTGNQIPYESTTVPLNAGERIVIVQVKGAGRFLHLDTQRGRLAISTQGSTRGHNCATNAFGVAAVNVANSYPNAFTGGSQNPVESFSSDGPRRIFFQADGTPVTPGNFSSLGGVLRQKPDIAAADGVTTDVPSPLFNPFFGTSAAAPHAAAIAALLKSYNNSLTTAQIRTILTNTALDIMSPGPDRDSGAGIVMALAALRSQPVTQAPPVLTNPQVTPASGTSATSFEFLVDYSDPNSLPPLTGSPTVYLSNDTSHQMTLKSGSTYHYTTTLSPGSYSYSFGAVNLLGGAAQTGWYGGPTVYSSGNATIDITIQCPQISPEMILQYSLTSATGPWTTIPVNQAILSPLVVPASSQVWFQASTSSANYTYRGWDAYVNGVHIGGNTASGWAIQLGTATELGLEVSYNYTPQSYTISGTALLSNGSQVPSGVDLVLTSSQQAVTNHSSNGSWSFSGVSGGVTVTITPSAAGYEFTPASLVFYDLQGNQSSQVFTANASDDSVPITLLTNLPPSVSTNAAVTFGWTGQDNVTPTASLQYQYKLDGVDAGWSAWSLATSASYTVSNGCYTFWVRAMDQAGNINQAPTNFTFVVNAGPVVLSAAQNNRSVWSSRLTVQMPVGASRPSSNIVILPAYSGLPDTDLVPVRIHRADQTEPAGANVIVASQLGLPALITKTTSGWLATLPDNLSPGQITNYDIVWGKVKYFGWQEDVSVPANFPNGGGILSSYLDYNLNLWRVAAKNYQYINTIGNEKAWVWMNMGNASGPVINETLLRYTPGHPDDGVTGYQTYYEFGSILKTTPNISLFWSDRENIYIDNGHVTSNLERYGVQTFLTNGTFLNSQDGVYTTNVNLSLPSNSVNNWLWFLYQSATNLFMSVNNYAGVPTIPATSIDNFSKKQSGFSWQHVFPIGTNALIIWQRYWSATNNNIYYPRQEIDYAIYNTEGQVITPRTVLTPVLADNITQPPQDWYQLESILTDNAGKVWISYYHTQGGALTNCYVVLGVDGSIWQGPVQTGSGRSFNFCDRDGLIWTWEGSQFLVLNPDGTTNVPPRIGAWTPNQPCSGISASVGSTDYRLYDRWSPQIANANIPQVDLPSSMEVYDLNLWSNGLHTANITIQNGTNTIWTQSGQFTGQVAVAVPGAFNAGQNTLTFSQNDFLGGQILVTFPYSFNHTISAAADAYASVSPSGNIVVTNGASATFSFSPSLYYHIASVQVDSSAVSTNSPYTFNNINQDHIIQVYSAPDLATNGVPHWWLAQYGLTNPTWDAAALADQDHDGMATWQEYIAGTSPVDANSRFAVKRSQILSGTTNFALYWDSVPGRSYTVYGRTNLYSGSWSNLYQVSGDGTEKGYTNNSVYSGQQFFKLGVQLQ